MAGWPCLCALLLLLCLPDAEALEEKRVTLSVRRPQDSVAPPAHTGSRIVAGKGGSQLGEWGYAIFIQDTLLMDGVQRQVSLMIDFDLRRVAQGHGIYHLPDRRVVWIRYGEMEGDELLFRGEGASGELEVSLSPTQLSGTLRSTVFPLSDAGSVLIGDDAWRELEVSFAINAVVPPAPPPPPPSDPSVVDPSPVSGGGCGGDPRPTSFDNTGCGGDTSGYGEPSGCGGDSHYDAGSGCEGSDYDDGPSCDDHSSGGPDCASSSSSPDCEGADFGDSDCAVTAGKKRRRYKRLRYVPYLFIFLGIGLLRRRVRRRARRQGA